MQAILKRAQALGIPGDQVEKVLNLHRPLSELAWTDARDVRDLSLKAAKEGMETNRYVEYECYDNSWNPHGRGVVKLGIWQDFDQGIFTGEHGPSSENGL